MTGRVASRSLLCGILLAAGLVAGCGVRPSGVITGGPAPVVAAEGVRLYLVSGGKLTPVLRAPGRPGKPAEILAMLAAGPDAEELARGLGSEIPPDAGPMLLTSDPSGITVTLSGDVSALSPLAVDQIVCTAASATATSQRAPAAAVTLVGPERSRGPQTCPLGG